MVVMTDRPPTASFRSDVSRCIAVVESRPLRGHRMCMSRHARATQNKQEILDNIRKGTIAAG